jgi:hypothetical protein
MPESLKVQKKLFAYWEKYLSIIKLFPQLDGFFHSEEFYKSTPHMICFYEFLCKIKDVTNEENIIKAAEILSDKYFYSVRLDRFIEKNGFIDECKKQYNEYSMIYLYKHDCDFRVVDYDESNPTGYYRIEPLRDKVELYKDVLSIDSDFNKLLKKCNGDMNMLDDEMRKFETSITEHEESDMSPFERLTE